MPYEPERRQAQPRGTQAPSSGRRPTLAAGLAAIFCLLVAIFNFVVNAVGGLPAEVPLFTTLALIFGALWYTLRKQERA
jgi:hypothetical protein